MTSARGVVWIEIQSGGIRFDDLAAPRFTTRHTLFPVAPDAWIQPIDEELGPLAVRPASTSGRAARRCAVARPAGLSTTCSANASSRIGVSARKTTSSRGSRRRRGHRERAQDLAYAAIGSVLGQETETPPEFLAATTAEPVLRACQMAGRALGLTVRAHPERRRAGDG